MLFHAELQPGVSQQPGQHVPVPARVICQASCMLQCDFQKLRGSGFSIIMQNTPAALHSPQALRSQFA